MSADPDYVQGSIKLKKKEKDEKYWAAYDKRTELLMLTEPSYVRQQNRAAYANNRYGDNKTAEQLKLKESR
jgi:hypothetical protein